MPLFAENFHKNSKQNRAVKGSKISSQISSGFFSLKSWSCVSLRTGEEEEFGASRASLNGGLHERRETELVALVDADSSEMMQ